MAPRTTAEIIDRFNHAFVDHDRSALNDLIAEVCVMEAIQPAPDGALEAFLPAGDRTAEEVRQWG